MERRVYYETTFGEVVIKCGIFHYTLSDRWCIDPIEGEVNEIYTVLIDDIVEYLSSILSVYIDHDDRLMFEGRKDNEVVHGNVDDSIFTMTVGQKQITVTLDQYAGLK
jgi:hypothetical protein